MEVNKNGLLFSYIDSLEDSNLYSKYKNLKIPSLNKYAENYLADLNKMKLYNYTNNNDSIENFNDYNTSVKDFSNDTSKETNIRANQLSKLNDNFTATRSDETNEIENNLCSKIKTNNNLEIEHLKKNFNFNKTKIEDISLKNKSTDNNSTNIGGQQKVNYTMKKYVKRNKNVISELYKKISSPRRKKLNSIISSDKSGHYKNKCQLYKRKNNLDFSSLSKSQISSNYEKSNEITNRFFYKGNSDCAIKTKIKTKLSSFLNRNILTKYLYSDRNKFKNNNNTSTSKNNNQLQNNFSESHTEESFAPYNSISYRCIQNKSVTHSMEDYWKEKELKKRMKLDKLRKEKIYKENCELRDRPKIDENSRKIANNIVYNSSINVFNRLSNLAKNNLYFKVQESKSKIKPEISNIYKFKLHKQINCQNYLFKNKGKQLEKKFKSFKQIDNNNNEELCEAINNEQDNKQLINLNKNVNKKENQNNDGDIDNKNKTMILNKVKMQWIERYDSNNSNNSNNKIMYKIKKLKNNDDSIKIKLKEPKMIKEYNNKNNKNDNIVNSIFVNKRDYIFSEPNSNKNIINNKLNKTIKENKSIKITSLKNKVKPKPKDFMINKIKIINSLQNINDVQIFTNGKQKLKKSNNKYINYNSKNKIKSKKKNKISKSNNKNIKLILGTESDYTITTLTKPNIDNLEYFNQNTNKDLIKYNDINVNNNNINKTLSYNSYNVKYYKMPKINELIKDNTKIFKYKTDYFNCKTEYDNNNENQNHNHINNFNKSSEMAKIDNNNEYRIIRAALEKDKNMVDLNNYINMPSSEYYTIEQSQDINRRRLDLLKLLDFSSKIGTTCDTN